jgi:hypothetical protein
MFETLELRQFCTASGGWAICASGGVGVLGVEVCAGNHGVSAGLTGTAAPWLPADVGVGYGIGWDGNQFGYTEFQVQGAAGPALSASVGTQWDKSGNVFSSTQIGAGVGIEYGDMGASVTYQATTDSAWWNW